MLCFNPFFTNDITKMEIRNQKQHCSLEFTLNIFCQRRFKKASYHLWSKSFEHIRTIRNKHGNARLRRSYSWIKKAFTSKTRFSTQKGSQTSSNPKRTRQKGQFKEHKKGSKNQRTQGTKGVKHETRGEDKLAQRTGRTQTKPTQEAGIIGHRWSTSGRGRLSQRRELHKGRE